MAAPNLKDIAGKILNRDMDAWLLAQRADERTMDWIARQIAIETNGAVTPTKGAVWIWLRDLGATGPDDAEQAAS